MSSILLTDDSWCELSSEAEGRDLTPVSFGQIPADMPMDVSAFLLRALGAEKGLDEASSGQWLQWDEKAPIWGRTGKMKALMGWCSMIAWTCCSMQLCTGPVSDLSFALCYHQLWREPWVCQMLSSLSGTRMQDLPLRANREHCKCLIATPFLFTLLPASSLQPVCSPCLPHSHYIFVQQQLSLLPFQFLLKVLQ